MHPLNGWGESFKMLGLKIDIRLCMEEAIAAILQKARPKMRALLRTRGQYSIEDMFLQFKTHILGILESNIGGIYHATDTALMPLDRLQRVFANNFNMDEAAAFQRYNLAPLCFRRDVVMSDFLHNVICRTRTVIFCYYSQNGLQGRVQDTASSSGIS